MKENVQRKSTMKEVLGNKSDRGRNRPLPLPLPLPLPPPTHGSFRLIKSDDKFFSRLLSKETSVANPSFRVYYGGKPGSIPFVWETQPGTPKHVLHDDPIPPLTPPPSYFANLRGDHCLGASGKKSSLRWSSSLLRTLVLRKSKNGRAVHSSPSSCDFSSSNLSTSSSLSSLALLTHNSSKRHGGGRRGRRFLSLGSMSFDARVDDDKEEVKPSGPPSPKLSALFGTRKKWGSLSNVGRCFSLTV